MWSQYASDNSKDFYGFVQNVCSEPMSPLPDHIETRKLINKGILTGGGGGAYILS